MVNKEQPKQIEAKETVEDSRFVMKGTDFEVNRFSEDYMLRHPHLKKQLLKEKLMH